MKAPFLPHQITDTTRMITLTGVKVVTPPLTCRPTQASIVPTCQLLHLVPPLRQETVLKPGLFLRLHRRGSKGNSTQLRILRSGTHTPLIKMFINSVTPVLTYIIAIIIIIVAVVWCVHTYTNYHISLSSHSSVQFGAARLTDIHVHGSVELLNAKSRVFHICDIEVHKYAQEWVNLLLFWVKCKPSQREK